MPTIGTDCDFTLQHASVNGGAAVGFLLRRLAQGKASIQIAREAYLTSDSSYADRYKITARVYMADNARNPDASIHSTGRDAAYALLLAFIAERTGITLVCEAGTFTGLHATLPVTSEFHFDAFSEVFLFLNNGGYDETIPVDLVRFNQSVWDGPLTWATSYWR